MSDSSNHGSGEVLNIARSPVVLSDAERDAGGGDVVIKTFGDAAGLTTSDNLGLRFGADIFSSITTVQVVFWGKEWTRLVPPPPVSMTAVSNAIAQIIGTPYLSALSQYGFNPQTVDLFFTVNDGSDPPLSPSTFNDSPDVWGMLQPLATAGTINAEERGGPAVPWGNPRYFTCVIMPTKAKPAKASLNGNHSWFSFGHARDVHGYNESKVVYGWVSNDGTLDTITTVFSHELVEALSDPEGDAIQVDPRNAKSWNEIGDVCSSTLKVGGVAVTSYWSTRDNACIVPISQSVSYRATCITKPGDRDSPYSHITHLGGTKDLDGSAWSFSAEQVIAMIDGGDRFYVHGRDGREADLEAYLYFPPQDARHTGHRRLRTKRDDDKADNLLQLPDC